MLAQKIKIGRLVFGVSNVNLEIIKKIEAKSILIDDIAEEVASGISTGGDKVFRLPKKECVNLGLEKELLHKVLVGGEINKYSVTNSNHYLLYMIKSVNIHEKPNALKYLSQFENKLAQKRETVKGMIPYWCLHWPRYKELFTENKIILRQTADKIIATYDENGFFVLNSILVFQLKKEVKFDYLFILSVLNSSLTQFIYKNLTQEEGRTFAEVKPKNVRKMYIPNITPEAQAPFITLVDKILQGKKDGIDTSAWERKIDEMVYKLYDLTPDEIAIVEGR